MSSEQELRLRLNELHLYITDALEQMDDHAFGAADATLDHMRSDIDHLREEVTALYC